MKNIISKLNRIKVRLFYKNHQTGTIYKHNIFYRLLSTIYNNIKYILNNDIKLIIEDIETDYNNSINDFKMELGSFESDIENKCDAYEFIMILAIVKTISNMMSLLILKIK